jgi:hypothetical protein
MYYRCCLIALASLFVSVPALAQRAVEENPWDRVLSINAQVGLGAPLGLGGIGLDLTPFRWFTIGAGVGYSPHSGSTGGGSQAALMSRLRYPFENGTAIALGGGVSTGPYHASPFMDYESHTVWTWDRAWWTNVELSIEHRWTNGVELRGFGGVGFLDNPTADTCAIGTYGLEKCPLTANDAFVSTVPYLGLSIGYALH